jgi:hypothetical protein
MLTVALAGHAVRTPRTVIKMQWIVFLQLCLGRGSWPLLCRRDSDLLVVLTRDILSRLNPLSAAKPAIT